MLRQLDGLGTGGGGLGVVAVSCRATRGTAEGFIRGGSSCFVSEA